MSEAPGPAGPPVRVVVVGGISTDTLVLADRLPAPGHPVQDAEIRDLPGGRGANQAVAAVRLGAAVTLVGRVGDDERGRRSLAGLAEDGVDVAHVALDPSTPTGRAVVLTAAGEQSGSAMPGANQRCSVHDVAAAAAALEAADVVLCSLEVPLPTARAALEIGRRSGALVALDPAPAVPGAVELVGLADVVTPNADEARRLTGVPVRDEAGARRAAARLLGPPPRHVAVSAGAAGDLLAWPGGSAWVPAPPVEVVDPLGGGDALVAALVVGLARGDDPAVAVRAAAAAAALSMGAVGARTALPTPDEIDDLLARMPG